jgi:hypothetical protein
MKLMGEKINAGTILIKEGTLLPECFQLETEPYSKGWRLVKNLGSSAIDRQLYEAGWSLRYVTDEVKATAVGSDLETTTRRAIKRLIAHTKSDTLNCLEIGQVAPGRFLGLACVTVSAQPRQIHESKFLFHLKQVLEPDRAKLAVVPGQT